MPQMRPFIYKMAESQDVDTEEMKYRKVQGWRVSETWEYQTNIATERIIRTQWIDLFCGTLIMKAGFCFEGSIPGPKWFLKLLGFLGKKCKRGYCAHDAGYDLIKNGHLGHIWKEAFDDLMHEIHLKDGMNRPAAKIAYKAVAKFGDFAINPANRARVQTAP